MGNFLKGLCEAPQGFSSGIFINGRSIELIWMKYGKIHGNRDVFSEVGNTESFFDLGKDLKDGEILQTIDESRVIFSGFTSKI